MSSSYTLHDLIASSFVRHAGQDAIRQGDKKATYAELDRQADLVAQFLLQQPGFEAGELIGISSAVTIESVTCLLGILRAGAAYVPLDVLSPPARLKSIIQSAAIKRAFIDPAAYPEIAELEDDLHVIRFSDDEHPWTSGGASGRLPFVALADDLAYVLYTSGSTGVPKGVMLTHRNAITFVAWMAEAFEVGPEDRVAGRSPLNFDFSVFDVFTTLLAGATLHLAEFRRGRIEGQTSEARHRRYVQMMTEAQCTLLYATPSALTVLLDKGGLSDAVPLRVIMYAGEPFHPPMLSRLMHALPNSKIANIYGPTETNIITCQWVDTPPTEAVPIGYEVDDTEIIVVDEQGQRCATGEVGELWARGGTVCVGYLGQPELTAKRRVLSPFHRYPVYYWRTGDLGRRREDGGLDYLGRSDDMVKTRGYRVEIGDVESALVAESDVVQAIVLHQPHAKYGATLHAFVRADATAKRTEDELLEAVRARLPSYMVPVDLRILDEFPYTSTGKVDRQTLRRRWLTS